MYLEDVTLALSNVLLFKKIFLDFYRQMITCEITWQINR